MWMEASAAGVYGGGFRVVEGRVKRREVTIEPPDQIKGNRSQLTVTMFLAGRWKFFATRFCATTIASSRHNH